MDQVNAAAQRPGEAPPANPDRWWTLAAVECGNFVVYMDGFIVTLALPAMARQFGVGLPVLKWVIVAYLLTVTVTLLPAGRLADIWGRRRIVVIGMGVLVVTSVLCALAPTVEILIGFRVLQGVGGGLVLANVMAEITAVFPKQERRKAMAVNASILALAQVTGLVLGGLLIGQFGWRSLFLVILTVSLAGLILSLWILKARPRSQDRTAMDWTGAVLAVVATSAPFLVIEQLSQDGLNPASVAILMGGAAALALFVGVEQRLAKPLLTLSLFRSRAFSFGSVAAAFYFVAAVACYFLLPLYAQLVLGRTPVMSGVLIVPLSLVLTATSLTVSSLGDRVGARTLSTAGMLCVSAGLVGLSWLGADAAVASIIWPLVLLGMGGGLFHPPNNSATLNTVPAQHLSVANGFLSMARNFGQAIGTALAASLLAHGLGAAGADATLAGEVGARLGGSQLEAFLGAQQLAFRLAAALGLVGALISVSRGAEAPAAQ
ncbi:MFS transporter [Cyanobium gracile]|uniref:Arabinose efflux permease family protein n=1 Tax=Cyanobium gracile (strain ATCC 27147 / PCC 6307) TaxID=292564 RepID=K9P6Y1_CYAGP|nr:MFS transporter [Cyanobium gracile]AFY29162.1 arabinose efflux permease family protein [Cyanobium gracile PCC 6307]